MMRGRDIVCMSSLDWDAHWTSKQQIMHRLAETNRVLYVEEPVTALAPLKVPSRWSRWKAVLPELRKERAGLWVLTPPPLSPFGNMYPLVNQANQRLLAGYVNWAAHKIGMNDMILWTYLPGSCDLIDHVHPAAVVYHCVDEHSAFPGFIKPEVVKAYDDELTRRADLVLTSAQNLLLSRRTLNPNIHRIRHAADVGLFATALDPELPIPADLAPISRPRLGVVGVHDERLDTEAVEALSAADPDWQIVLVGPVVPGDVDEGHLRALPNLHFLGGKPVSELPAYLKGLDVALIPYKLNELTRNIFPLKLYEYLAAGIPVVAAALPELAPYADQVGLAATPADYPRLVKEALAGDSPEARAARAAAVAGETWEKRVEEMSDLVEQMWARVARSSAARPDAAWRWKAPAAAGAGSRWPSVSVLGFRLDLVKPEEAARWVVTTATAEAAAPTAGRGADPARPRRSSPPRRSPGTSRHRGPRWPSRSTRNLSCSPAKRRKRPRSSTTATSATPTGSAQCGPPAGAWGPATGYILPSSGWPASTSPSVCWNWRPTPAKACISWARGPAWPKKLRAGRSCAYRDSRSRVSGMATSRRRRRTRWSPRCGRRGPSSFWWPWGRPSRSLFSIVIGTSGVREWPWVSGGVSTCGPAPWPEPPSGRSASGSSGCTGWRPTLAGCAGRWFCRAMLSG